MGNEQSHHERAKQALLKALNDQIEGTTAKLRVLKNQEPPKDHKEWRVWADKVTHARKMLENWYELLENAQKEREETLSASLFPVPAVDYMELAVQGGAQ